MGDGANNNRKDISVKRRQETDVKVGFNDNKGTSCRIGLSTICTSESGDSAAESRPLNIHEPRLSFRKTPFSLDSSWVIELYSVEFSCRTMHDSKCSSN